MKKSPGQSKEKPSLVNVKKRKEQENGKKPLSPLQCCGVFKKKKNHKV